MSEKGWTLLGGGFGWGHSHSLSSSLSLPYRQQDKQMTSWPRGVVLLSRRTGPCRPSVETSDAPSVFKSLLCASNPKGPRFGEALDYWTLLTGTIRVEVQSKRFLIRMSKPLARRKSRWQTVFDLRPPSTAERTKAHSMCTCVCACGCARRTTRGKAMMRQGGSVANVLCGELGLQLSLHDVNARVSIESQQHLWPNWRTHPHTRN